MSGWGKADNKTASGTVAITTGGAVTGTSTSFTTEAEVGDFLRVGSQEFIIVSITDNTTATVINANPQTTWTAVSAGASYTLSEKPISLASDGSILSTNVYGVDTNEMAANSTVEGAAHTGWNHVRQVGSRKIVETLVALSKNGITGDAEDTVFEDFLITIVTQPANSSETSGDPASFEVVASITGTGGTLTYQWQVDSGSGFGDVTNGATGGGGTYSGATTDTLAISDNTGLDTYEYRCVVSATGADSVTSDAATLTEA